MNHLTHSSIPALRVSLRIVAGLAAAVVCLATVKAEDATLKIARSDNEIAVTRDAKPVLNYQAAANPFKPYVKELFTPGGVQVLRDSPHDHKHHHALMLAIGVNGVDFWGEAGPVGTQKSVKIGDLKATVKDGSGRAGFVQDLNWEAAGKTLLTERRAIEVNAMKDGKPVTFVNWNSRLSAPQGADSVKLTAEGHHYYGLGMRFLVSMDTGGKFFNSTGQPGEVIRGSERLVNAKWCAYTAQADGKTVTVAVFDHPKNPRHPNKIFTMAPFAYLSATLNLWKDPMTLKAGEPLDLRWGVALWDGEVSAEQVEALYKTWAEERK